jgi:hypothetical protein
VEVGATRSGRIELNTALASFLVLRRARSGAGVQRRNGYRALSSETSFGCGALGGRWRTVVDFTAIVIAKQTVVRMTTCRSPRVVGRKGKSSARASFVWHAKVRAHTYKGTTEKVCVCESALFVASTASTSKCNTASTQHVVMVCHLAVDGFSVSPRRWFRPPLRCSHVRFQPIDGQDELVMHTRPYSKYTRTLMSVWKNRNHGLAIAPVTVLPRALERRPTALATVDS